MNLIEDYLADEPLTDPRPLLRKLLSAHSSNAADPREQNQLHRILNWLDTRIRPSTLETLEASAYRKSAERMVQLGAMAAELAGFKARNASRYERRL